MPFRLRSFTWLIGASIIAWLIQAAPAQGVPIGKATGPAINLAYVQQQQLFLQSIGTPDPTEYKIPLNSDSEIIGWSADGNWLAFKQWQTPNNLPYLWIADRKGNHLQQVDSRPIYEVAGWAPGQSMLAYSTTANNKSAAPNNNLVLAELNNNKWTNRDLVASSSEACCSPTWLPNGKYLALVLTRTLDSPIKVDRVDLEGRRVRLAILKGDDLGKLGDDEIFILNLRGLRFSPNGRYLAGFLSSNSVSYDGDGMPVCIIDTKRNSRVTVGKGLGYKDWLAWSADSKKLAFINGMGRSSTTNKLLYIAEIGKGKLVKKVGKKLLVDCRPDWYGKSLFFARGAQIETWDTLDKRVPGQQIAKLKGGKITLITNPGGKKSDYPLSLDPTGKYLIFLRLTNSQQGSLVMLETKNGNTSIIIDRIRGTDGYYGNFYPDWVKVHWPLVTAMQKYL